MYLAKINNNFLITFKKIFPSSPIFLFKILKIAFPGDSDGY